MLKFGYSESFLVFECLDGKMIVVFQYILRFSVECNSNINTFCYVFFEPIPKEFNSKFS